MDNLPTVEGYTTSFNDLFKKVVFSSNNDGWNFSSSEEEVKKLQSIGRLKWYLEEQHRSCIDSRKRRPLVSQDTLDDVQRVLDENERLGRYY